MDKLATATHEELIEVPEIGERIAESVIKFFENADNVKEVQRLKQTGVQFEIIENVIFELKTNKVDIEMLNKPFLELVKIKR